MQEKAQSRREPLAWTRKKVKLMADRPSRRPVELCDTKSREICRKERGGESAAK